MNTQLNLFMALLPYIFVIPCGLTGPLSAGGLSFLSGRQAAAFSNDTSSHLAAGGNTSAGNSASVTSTARTGGSIVPSTSGSSTSQRSIDSETNTTPSDTTETDSGSVASTPRNSTSAGSTATVTNTTEVDGSAAANASRTGSGSVTRAAGAGGAAVAGAGRSVQAAPEDGRSAGRSVGGQLPPPTLEPARPTAPEAAAAAAEGKAALLEEPRSGTRGGRPPRGVWWGRPRARAGRPQEQASQAGGGEEPYAWRWPSLGRMGAMLLQDGGPGPGWRLGPLPAWMVGAGALVLALALVPVALCCARPRAEEQDQGEHPEGKRGRWSCLGRRPHPGSVLGSASSLAASNCAIDDTRPASSRAGSRWPDARPGPSANPPTAEPNDLSRPPTSRVYTFG